MTRLVKRFALLMALLGSLFAITGCGRSAPLADGDLVTLRLLPDKADLYRGQVAALTVEARWADGRVEDVTTEPGLIFKLNQTGVISLLEGGRLRADAAGQVNLLVAWQGKQDSSVFTVSDATLEDIDVEPDEMDLPTGDTQQLALYGLLSDGQRVDLTPAATGTTYESDQPAVATVTPDGLVFAMNKGTSLVRIEHAGFEQVAVIRVDGGTPRLTTLELLPAEASLPAGEVLALQLVGTFDDGSIVNLTEDPESVYASADPSVATVDDLGRVTGLSRGQTEISAVYQQLTAVSAISITDPFDLVGIQVTPDRAALAPGAGLQLVTTAVYADGSQMDVTGLATYESSNPAAVQVDAGGQVLAVDTGQAQVLARYEGFSDGCQVTVSAARLEEIWIEQGAFALAPGEQQQLTVMGRYSDGSTADISRASTGTGYAAAPVGIVAISADGLVSAVGAGQTTVTAVNSGLSDQVQVTVTGAQLVDLVVIPSSLDLVPGEVAQLNALAFYDDGSSLSVTDQATWGSDAPGVASVSLTGEVRALAAGQAAVTASFGGLQAQATVRVQGPVLIGLGVQPASLVLAIGEQANLTVTGFYSDGTNADVTAQASFASSAPTVVSAAAGGLVTALDAGQAVVTANLQGFSDICQVSVPQVELVDFWIEPGSINLQSGGQRQLTAWARYSDGSVIEVTAAAAYLSADPGIASVTDAGLVTGQSEGSTTITADYAGFTAQSAVEVQDQPTLERIEVQPPSAVLDQGEVLDLTVTAFFTDGSTQDVTGLAGYGSSSPGVAAVVGPGQVEALAGGQAVVTASYGGFTDTCDVTVIPQVVQTGLRVLPASASLDVGDTLQLTVWADYSDGSSQDVTALAAYNSSAPSVAAVSGTGLVSALDGGQSIVQASYGGFNDAVQITVIPSAVQIGLRVLPASASLDVGDSLQLTVWADYSDGSSQDVTALAAYNSSAPSVASVSGTGLVSALSDGLSIVQAVYGGFNDSAQITVNPPVVEWIELLPASALIGVGETIQFSVTAHYSDGSIMDVTEAVFGTTYQSSDPGVLMIDMDGFAWSLAEGAVSVTARFAGFTDTAQVVVEDNPIPTLSSIDPEQVLVGATGTPLTAWGADFIPTSVVRLDGIDLATTYLAADRLSVTIPDWTVAAVGIHKVSVFNPAPGGGTSGELDLLTVDLPVISTVSPSSGQQGRSIRVGLYGSGLLGCSLVTDNPGIAISALSHSPDGTTLFATFSIDPAAALGPATITASNLAGDADATFTVIEDQGNPDCIVDPGEVVFWNGVQTCADVVIGTGATVYGTGAIPLEILATGDVTIRGEIYVSGFVGEDGFYNPAAGGVAGPGGGGGGGGGDGRADGMAPAMGGLGSPSGEDGQVDAGAGTPSGDGGGVGAGSGISGGCGQAGGGGAFGGDGGGGGGDAGIGFGGPGGAANTQGSDYNGGTGGGGGSTCGPNSGGGGGGGGGVLVIATTGGFVSIQGALFADGGQGGDGYNGTGSGGGGSGGRITVTTAGGLITLEDTISVRGADGGRADSGDAGGGGGGGRILVDAGGGGVDDALGYYDLTPGIGGESRDNGFDGEPGQPGVVSVQP